MAIYLKYTFAIRISILIVLLAGIFTVGFVKQKFILNFTNSTYSFFLPRQAPNLQAYPSTLSGISERIIQDPRWVSSVVYSFLYILLSTSFIYILFRYKIYIKLTLFIYAVLIVISWFLIMIGNTFQSYKLGYGLSQNIKDLIQSPFVLMVLIPLFRLHKHSKLG